MYTRNEQQLQRRDAARRAARSPAAIILIPCDYSRIVYGIYRVRPRAASSPLSDNARQKSFLPMVVAAVAVMAVTVWLVLFVTIWLVTP